MPEQVTKVLEPAERLLSAQVFVIHATPFQPKNFINMAQQNHKMTASPIKVNSGNSNVGSNDVSYAWNPSEGF